jgi:hypothetical protein
MIKKGEAGNKISTEFSRAALRLRAVMSRSNTKQSDRQLSKQNATQKCSRFFWVISKCNSNFLPVLTSYVQYFK